MTQPQGGESGEFVMPPLGIRPRFLVDEGRAREIVQGMDRYIEAGVPVPREWLTELSELHDRIRAHAAARVRQGGQQQ